MIFKVTFPEPITEEEKLRISKGLDRMADDLKKMPTPFKWLFKKVANNSFDFTISYKFVDSFSYTVKIITPFDGFLKEDAFVENFTKQTKDYNSKAKVEVIKQEYMTEFDG